MQDAPRYRVYRPQAMYDTLRRLHGQDLENKGLNNLTEAFQNFMTRARCYALGNLRRTWSHGAVEFMKYRRLLPMLVADEHDLGSAFDDFDAFDAGSSSQLNSNHKIIVTNVPSRATISQLSSFFSKFGIVKSCDLFNDERKHTIYATMWRHSKKPFSVMITFSQAIAACRAQSAPAEELKLYGLTMIVSSYSNPKSVESANNGDEAIMMGSTDSFSRSSSAFSAHSLGTSQMFRLDELPSKALELIFWHLNLIDRIRLERTCKVFLEASAKAWSHSHELNFQSQELSSFFNHENPLKAMHVRYILGKCSLTLRKLNLSNGDSLLDDKIIWQMGQLCPNLEELDISGIAASPEALQSLSENLLCIRSLSYRGMSNATESIFWSLFKCAGRTLRAVDLRGCSQLTGHCFKLFGAALEQVLLDGCYCLSDECIEELAGRCKQLKVLHISGCYGLSNQALSLISRHFCNLHTLALAGEDFKKICNDVMFTIVKMTSLVRLDLSFNPLIDSHLISSLAKGLQNLRSISLAYCGTDSSVDSEGLCSIGQIKSLRELDLSGLAAVTSTVVETIFRQCNCLCSIVLHCCIYLSDEGVKSMQFAQALRLADLSGCILVTHDSVQFLLNKSSTTDENTLTIRLGGTVCESYSVRNRNSRITLDFIDYSSGDLDPGRKFLSSESSAKSLTQGKSAVECSFTTLSAHRSFVAEALAEVEPSMGADDENWATKEAASLGLI